MALHALGDELRNTDSDDSNGNNHAPINNLWMIAATIASVLAVLLIIGMLVWAVLDSRAAARRAESRLATQQELLTQLEEQNDRLEDLQNQTLGQTELLVTMGEDQLTLLEKVDVQTETIEELVSEIEMLQRETIIRVNNLEFEIVEIPGEPGRVETRIVTEPEVVEVPEIIRIPVPEPKQPVPGIPCDELPPESNRKHCR